MLESGWGKAAIGNNLFGMTVGSSWTVNGNWSLLARSFQRLTKSLMRLNALFLLLH